MSTRKQKEKNVAVRLSIASLVMGILAVLSSPVVLVVLFGISWALADSDIPPLISDRMMLFGLNGFVYLSGLIPIILGGISLAKRKRDKKVRNLSIVGIILGILTTSTGIIYSILLMTTWYV